MFAVQAARIRLLPGLEPLMGGSRRRAHGTHARAAPVSCALLTVLIVCGCSHHAVSPRQAQTAITVGVDGRIGPLQVDASDRGDVISFAGRPDAERRGRNTVASPVGSAPYDALGYDFGRNPGPALPLLQPGPSPKCRTVFFLDRSGRPGLFYTTQTRYVESHGVRIGMPTATAGDS
jgi:hypothetical protein